MKESSAKLPPGLFGAYNYHADGLFDECLAIQAPSFEGKYCTLFLKPVPVEESEILPPSSSVIEDPNERSNFITIFQLLGLISGPDRVEPKVAGIEADSYGNPSVSFCLPSSCSGEDLGQAVAQLIGSYVIANHSIVTVIDDRICYTDEKINEPPNFDAADIVVMYEILYLISSIRKY